MHTHSSPASQLTFDGRGATGSAWAADVLEDNLVGSCGSGLCLSSCFWGLWSAIKA